MADEDQALTNIARVKEGTQRDVGDANDALMFRDLPVGTTVRLRNGSTGVVTGNPGDGAWLFLRILGTAPDEPDEEQMVFCVDVVGIA